MSDYGSEIEWTEELESQLIEFESQATDDKARSTPTTADAPPSNGEAAHAGLPLIEIEVVTDERMQSATSGGSALGLDEPTKRSLWCALFLNASQPANTDSAGSATDAMASCQ